MDHSKFLSKCTKRNKKNLLRKMLELFLKYPNSISLANGMPNAHTFPIEEITFTYRGGKITKLKGQELAVSLQYSAAQGYGPLREKLREFQERWHAPKGKEWDVIFTVGSQNACQEIFKMLVNENEAVMVQIPTYPGVLGALGAILITLTMISLASTKTIKIQLGEGKNNPLVIPVEEIKIRFKGCEITDFSEFEIMEALNLGSAQGSALFLKKMRKFQTVHHSPLRDDWDILAVTGAQDGLDRVFQALINSGDPVMLQVPIYFGILGIISPLNPTFIGIPQDADGVIPTEIAKVCEERRQSGKPMPKFLYVNPTGANPTGTSLTEERKRQIYEIAQKYDFLIVEDDAYYFVHFLDEQPKSFFSIDTDGRVIRLDSFSKILSAGIRLGVVTAHTNLIKKLIVHVENSILHTSTLSQVLVYKLFDSWTPQQFEKHFEDIQNFYRKKRDAMVAAIEKYLSGLAEWSVPKGGMFVWVKVKGIHNVMDLVMDKCVANGVFVLPGNAFHFDSTIPNQHLRFSYSYATEDEIDKGLSIVARLIQEEISKTNGVS